MSQTPLIDILRSQQSRRTVDLEVLTCLECGLRFGIDRSYSEALHRHYGGCEPPEGEEDDKAGWFACPNGHRQKFVQSSEKILHEKLVELCHTVEQSEATIARLERRLRRAENARDKFKRTVDRLRLNKGDDANALQPVARRQAKAVGGNRV